MLLLQLKTEKMEKIRQIGEAGKNKNNHLKNGYYLQGLEQKLQKRSTHSDDVIRHVLGVVQTSCEHLVQV